MIAKHLLTLLATAALAQPAAIDPPLIGRPDRFSNIVGNYDLQVSAEPTEVCVEEAITLRIRITGSGPAKYEPDRKHLQILPNWDDDFFVQEMPAEPRADRAKNTWLFVYRLKPKHTKVSAIDDIRLVYYDPKQKFITIEADPIKITVKPKPANLNVDTPLAAPESLFECAPSWEVLARPVFPIEVQAEDFVFLIVGPALAFLFFLFWDNRNRRYYASRRCQEAARHALAALGHGSEWPWSIVCRYLRDRFDFTGQDASPREVARFLKRRGFALERCARSEAFLQACDALQFAGQPADVKALAGQAMLLIEALEADPCVR